MAELSAFEHSDGEIVVDSRLIASQLGIEHRNFLSNLDTYKAYIERTFGVLRFETAKPSKGSKGGRPQRFALLTEDQSMFIMTLSRNTPRVIQCKADLVKAFSKAKEILRQRKFTNATYKIYLLDDPVKWAERGRIFQESFYSEIYRLNNWNYYSGKPNHPVRVAQITIDAIYKRLQPGVWEELMKKNPKVKGRRKYCCHQFLTESIGNPHLRHHLYSVTKLMTASSSWQEFMALLNKIHPKTNEVQMDILFQLLSEDQEARRTWERLVS